MRRTILLIVSTLLLSGVAAQTRVEHSRGSSFEVCIGGGYSDFGYKPQSVEGLIEASGTGSYSLQAHVGYNWFFIEYMGLAVGLDASHYGAGTSLKGALKYGGVTDTDGELYDHTTAIDWTERQDLWALEVPVSLVFAIPIQDVVYLTLQAGAKFGLPLSSRYTGSGETTHTGYYEPWDLTLRDKPNHGFYTESAFRPSGTWSAKNYWAVFAKAGVAIPLVEHLDLLVQGYFNYALTDVSEAGKMAALGFRNDRSGMEQAHYFMADYTDLSNTAFIDAAYRPWSAGVEVGVRYTIPHKKKRSSGPCRCLNEYQDPRRK